MLGKELDQRLVWLRRQCRIQTWKVKVRVMSYLTNCTRKQKKRKAVDKIRLNN